MCVFPYFAMNYKSLNIIITYKVYACDFLAGYIHLKNFDLLVFSNKIA